MSTIALLEKAPTAGSSALSRSVIVSLKGNITTSNKISSRIVPLVESFLQAAGLKGNFTFQITGPNDCVTYHAEDWIRIRSEGNGRSCGIVVRIGTNDCRYGGYLHSQSGHPPQYLFTALNRYTEKGFWHPSKPTSPKARSTVELGAKPVVQPSTPTATETTKPVEPVITPSSPEEGRQHESIVGMSDDIESLKLLKMAIQELHPSGRAPIKGLTFGVINKVGLNVSPNAVGPLFRAMINRNLMKPSADGLYYELTPDEPETPSLASPVVPEKAPSSVAPSQSGSSVVDPTSMLVQMETMIRMARELGQASDKSGQLTVQIDELQCTITSREAELKGLKERLTGLETQRAEVSRIMNSEPHKRARTLIAQMRDISLS